jgi:hypothetical protein
VYAYDAVKAQRAHGGPCGKKTAPHVSAISVDRLMTMSRVAPGKKINGAFDCADAA